MPFLVTGRSGTYKIDVKIAGEGPIAPARSSYTILVDRVVADYSLSSDASGYWVAWAVLIYGMKYDKVTGEILGEACEEIRPESDTWLAKLVSTQAPSGSCGF